MLSTALVCNVLFLLSPETQPAAGGPTVIAAEITDVRHARLKSKEEPAGPRFSFERTGMKLVVEVQGPDVTRASHFGMLEIDAAADDKGGKLKLNEEELDFHDFRKEFVPIDRERMFMGVSDPPKDVIRVEIPFASPPRAATSVSVRGKLQLKRVETVDVLVPATLGEVKDEQLEKLGVKVKIIKPGDEKGFTYEVSGKTDALNEAQIVDAQGKPVETNGYSFSTSGETLHRDIYLEKPVPADAKLKLSLVLKASNVPVTFDLKDVKLP